MCKECPDSIFREIKLPDNFNFKKNKDTTKRIYLPYKISLNKLYYHDREEFFKDLDDYLFSIGDTVTVGENVIARRREHDATDGLTNFYITISRFEDVFLNYILSTPETPYNALANYMSFSTTNDEFDRYFDNHPSFLKKDYSSYRTIAISKIKNPTWFINFNSCNNKELPDYNFHINTCGKNLVHSRLRIHPFLFMSGVYGISAATHVDKNIPFYLENAGQLATMGRNYTYDELQAIHDLQLAIETEEGSKQFGITPMRVEYGIYTVDDDIYSPIVWSDHNYPQIVAGYNHWYWEKSDPLKIKNPDITLQNTVLSPNVNTSVTSYSIINATDEELLYYNYANVISNGMFTTTSNNMNNPGYVILDIDSQLEGIYQDGQIIETNELVNIINEYFVDYRDPAENLDGMKLFINYEYLIDNSWTPMFDVEYRVSNVNVNSSNITFGIDSSSQIWVYTSYEGQDYLTIPNEGAGPVTFFKSTEYLSRYSINIQFERLTKYIPSWNFNDQKLKNYTDISNDFIIEIEGTYEFDFEKGKEYQMYLRVLPDTTNNIDLHLEEKTITPIRLAGPYIPDITYSAVPIRPKLTTANCNVNIVSTECQLWGELSVSSKTGYVRQENVNYEPFLPLHQRYINNTNKNISEYDLARDSFRYGFDLNPQVPALYMMIESGFIKIEKTCDCC